jgi:peptide/nickel transport system substrate-binding protein
MTLFALVLAAACAPAPAPVGNNSPQRAAALAAKTLVFVHGGETPTFAWKELLPTGAATSTRSAEAKLLLNARLIFLNEQGLPQPFLAEAVPDLTAGSWLLLPDGRMETSFHLRPNLTWHDGQPLTADDFVFASQVYARPEFGVSANGGFKYVEETLATDPRTVLIRWKQPYPDAVTDVTVLPPLPRHILHQPYQDLQPDPFMALQFWREDYVGAGPWRLERREPGSFFEATAFDGFVFGRPKIDRVRVVYIPDTNTAVVNMLSGEVHYAMESLFYGEEGFALERGWANGGGTVTWEQISPRTMEFQLRPEFAVPRELATDVRVRQAVVYAIDREALLEALTAGHGMLRDVYTHPNADYYDAVARAVTVRYRADPRRAEQLLQEAGFARGSDGIWASPSGERFAMEQWYIAGATNERESTILVDGLRRFGIDASSHVFGVQRTSQEDRSKSPGLFGGSKEYPRYHSAEIARPENRWTGANRFGYTNSEMDRLVEGWDTTLDRAERVQRMAEMERIAMAELPAIPMYWNPRVMAWVAGLKGTVTNLTPDGGGERRVWEWYWES